MRKRCLPNTYHPTRDHFKPGAMACRSAPSSLPRSIRVAARYRVLVRPGKKKRAGRVVWFAPGLKWSPWTALPGGASASVWLRPRIRSATCRRCCQGPPKPTPSPYHAALSMDLRWWGDSATCINPQLLSKNRERGNGEALAYQKRQGFRLHMESVTSPGRAC
jgi:hypothetical protein